MSFGSGFCQFITGKLNINLSLSLVFPTRSDINRAVQPQKIASGLKFQSLEVEALYYLCSKKKRG